MNIEKMREEFEIWYTQKANKDTGMVMSMEDIASMRGTKMDYGAYGYMHGCWIGWQASRAAIEVELPEHFEYDNPGEAFPAIKDCRKAIESLGLKVKA